MITRDFYRRFARTLVVVVSPHPDDSVLGAGGLVHLLTDEAAWARHARIPESDRPAVYTIVMTSGSRGIDAEYLKLHARDRLEAKARGLSGYLSRRESGSEHDERFERVLTEVCEDIRREESQAEALRLRVRESYFLNLRGIYHNHAISEDDEEAYRRVVNGLVERHAGWRRLFLVAHRDDMHPVHKLSTELAATYVERELGWRETTLWQYESPWITFSPHQVEFVVPFDGDAMTTKAEAMALHASQQYRTKYSDVARYRAQMRAETFPELLGGFGQSEHRWDFVEAFQELRPVTVLGVHAD